MRKSLLTVAFIFASSALAYQGSSGAPPPDPEDAMNPESEHWSDDYLPDGYTDPMHDLDPMFPSVCFCKTDTVLVWMAEISGYAECSITTCSDADCLQDSGGKPDCP